MKRRIFIKHISALPVGFSLANLVQGCTSKSKPLFSFVQLNDTHIHVPENPAYEKTNEKLAHVIDSINRETHFPLPDFVILVGDLIHGGKLDYLLTECQLAKEMLNKLDCPYYPVIGNHEVIQREGIPEFQGAYESVFGSDRVNYFFEYEGILFICMNNSNGVGSYHFESEQDHEYSKKAKGWASALKSQNALEIVKKRNTWLEMVLADHPYMPKIIACHIPLVSLREETVLAQSFGFFSYKMFGSNTLNIIQQHQDTIVAVLNGHLHLSGAAQKEGIYHISSSGLASYPCDYVHYTVFRDHIDVQMFQLPKELVTPNTNIHGQQRHNRVFTDSSHPTPEDYVRGTRSERQFTIHTGGLQ